MQVHSCLEPDIGTIAIDWPMAGIENDIRMVQDLVKFTGLSVAAMSRRIGVANTTLNRFNNGTASTRLHRDTLARLKQAWPDFPGFGAEADLPTAPALRDYVEVDILPTYAGAGGGGTGEGDVETALIPRVLIEDVLRGKAADFLLIDIRGDSMEPDFRHGDQLLVDRRDRSWTQPGPFAIWDGEYEEYVVKNLERAEGGQVRIFSSNTKYSPRLISSEETRVIGRPVWFGRRL